MRFPSWVIPTLLLATHVSYTTAKPLFSRYRLQNRNEYDEAMKRASDFYQGDLEKRSSELLAEHIAFDLSRRDDNVNVNTQAACLGAMSGMANVSNPAGFAACYNILDWQENTGTFQADLRLFQVAQPSPSLGDLPTSDMTVVLNFPPSTQFKLLPSSKRSISDVDRRGDGPTEIQHFSLSGSMKMQLDLQKLQAYQVLSLLVPQVEIQSPSTVFNMSTSDNRYFVAGVFQDVVSTGQSQAATKPSTAADAISAVQGFVLPGTTFGIFPTGLIVTGSWTVLFLVAYGFGTICRFRERSFYRKRIEATIGMRLGVSRF